MPATAGIHGLGRPSNDNVLITVGYGEWVTVTVHFS